VSKAYLTPSTANSSGTLYWRISGDNRSKRKSFEMILPSAAPSARKHFSHLPTTLNTVPLVRKMYSENRKPSMPEKGGQE
jgi:hypothetical protein